MCSPSTCWVCMTEVMCLFAGGENGEPTVDSAADGPPETRGGEKESAGRGKMLKRISMLKMNNGE